MRVAIREQLAALVLLSTLVGLAVISVATWITNENLVIGLRSSRLEVTASLIASQLSSNLALYERSARGLSGRALLQEAIASYHQGNTSANNWVDFAIDFETTGAAQQYLINIQTRIFAPNDRIGHVLGGLANATVPNVSIKLPYTRPDGTPIHLGDPDGGYPQGLYPNLTYHNTEDGRPATFFEGKALNRNTTILLGPWQINSTFALFSVTVPIMNNTSLTAGVIGWSSLIMNAQLFLDVVDSPIGMDDTGTVLLVGPDTVDNRFHNQQHRPSESSKVRFLLPPDESRYEPKRHSLRDYGAADPPFRLSQYPAIADGLARNRANLNDAGSDISCTNEQGQAVSIGFAIPQSEMCDWILVVEQAKGEALEPIADLRNILLACVFGTAGAMILFIYPLAHYASRPIRRLRDATMRSTETAQCAGRGGRNSSISKPAVVNGKATSPNQDSIASIIMDEKRGSKNSWGHFFKAKQAQVDVESQVSALSFRVPSKVPDRKHLIEDELTDLTHKFNEMTDALALQYATLEERVALRTAELEESKKAAEAANESKTLFIANISHELRTPLNGILGGCALALHDEDIAKIKSSLQLVYVSGNLLHHLLTDLLTFSQNEAGKNLRLQEKELRVRDLGLQLQTIFQAQVNERQMNFSISYQGICDAIGTVVGVDNGEYGPSGIGRIRDMCVWGDLHRLLQVNVILLSNALKFTPPKGTVHLKIKCVDYWTGRAISGDALENLNMSAITSAATDVEGNKEMDGDPATGATIRERHSFTSNSSDVAEEPPLNADTLSFEFEVSDNGPGIPQHLQEKIFEPFVQGDLKLTKKYGGTGLGLSIIVQLAKLMNAEVKLQSEVGVGSSFTFRVPLKLCRLRADSSAASLARMSISSRDSHLVPPSLEESSQNPRAFETDRNPRLVGLSQPYFSAANPPMASPTGETPKKENKLKVLVAEDNKVNQEVVLRMLRLEEIFDVHIAKDGQEAVEFVKKSMEDETPYSLIFMDIMMPNLDGRESTRLIREIGYSAPIVALTAFADEVNKKECMDSGMDYFLSKPIKRPALKHVLKTYCAPIEEMEESDGNKDPASEDKANQDTDPNTTTTTTNTKTEASTSRNDTQQFANINPFDLRFEASHESRTGTDSPMLTPRTTNLG